nr:TMV resistance protein N-like [Tanacetum cinerariifolium]
SNKQNFESSSFVEEIGKHYKQPDGLFGLQKQLLRDVLGEKNITISSVSEGTCKIEKVLQTKRVLIVLDDIDEDDVLAALLGTKMFHSQSKIIITSRHLDINGWLESIFRACQVYNLELMKEDESLDLFSFHAFGSKLPKEGFKDLAVELAHYCGGNPLALKVLGSSLRKRDNLESWTSILNSLSSLKGDLDSKIQ